MNSMKSMSGPSGVTLALTAATLALVALVHTDPWRSEGGAAPLLSTQSATRRLFPDLAEADLARATIRLRTPAGELRLAPGDDGLHQLWQGETPLGWADGEALAGLWSSLRMATTLRAVTPGSALGEPRGDIVVELDDRSLGLQIFGEASDGAGLHGVLPHEGEAAWVVEPEMAEILAQAPTAWLLRRLLPMEPADAAALRWDGVEIVRGADGLWRVTAGAPKLLLAEQAVALRLAQVFSAELAPLLPRAPGLGPFTGAHSVTDAMGHVRKLLSGGTCPEDPARILVDRGPGLLGCVEREVLAPWPIADPDAGLVEPQLAPHAYGRVLAVAQTLPNARRLRRFGGGWVLEEGEGMSEVAEPEVFRWYSALQAAEVELPREPIALTPTHRFTIETDSGQALALACGRAGKELACARDDGPALRVRGTPPELTLSRELFADRRLLSFESGEVRSLEILPGASSQDVRQSVRLDLGVWRLDAPAHPDGVAVLDEVRLEAILAALQGLRAELWVPVPAVAPLRTLRLERTRSGPDGENGLAVELYPGPDPDAACVGHLPGDHQAALLARDTCTTLLGDLLYDDPLRFWLGQGRSAQLSDATRGEGERTATLRRDGDAWSVESGEPTLLSELPGWAAFRSAGLRTGEPRGATAITAKISRSGAAAVRVDLGPQIDGAPAWVRLAGAPWYYLAGPPARDDAAQ